MVREPALKSNVLGGTRILVVDDSDATRAVLSGILQRFGAEVYEAASGPEAIGLVKAMPVPLNAILLDMVLDNMDGIETADRIDAWTPNGKSIIVPMGASIDDKIKEQLLAAGIEAAPLHKPYSPRGVVGAVIGVMKGRAGEFEAVSVPVIAPSEIQNPPFLAGIDVHGAFERCFYDANLLRRVVLDCQATSRPGFFRAREAVDASNFKTAIKILHKFRGELLNLGMVTFVEELVAIQSRIADLMEIGASAEPAKGLTQTQPLRPLQIRSVLAKKIEALSDKLDQQFIAYLSHPDLLAASRMPLFDQASSEKVADEAAFEQLLGFIKDHDLRAIDFVKSRDRIMPLRYSIEIERLFRQHVESLDFELALLLVGARDLAEARSTEEGNQRRILLVEKTPLTIRLLANILSELGILRLARSSAEAIAMVEGWRPDLILADVDLDDRSGIELCRVLKSSGTVTQSPFILLSSSDDSMTEVLGLTAGAVDFIEMPIMPARVLGRIRGHLGSHSSPAVARSSVAAPQGGEQVSGYMVVDSSGKLVAASPVIVSFMGGESKYIGGELAALFRGADVDRMLAVYSRSIEFGRADAVQAYLCNAAGDKLPMRFSGRKVSNESGSVVWISCESDVDIVLEQAHETHKEVSRVLANLSGGIAHEFNNQLSIIIGNLDLVLDSGSALELAEPLRRARTAALRLAVTSRSMGEASIGRGQPAGLPERVHTLIQRYVGVWRSLVPGNIVFEQEPGNDDCWIKMASDDFRWCIAALIDNAVEAMPNGGRLTLRCRMMPADNPQRKGCNDIVVELEDTGYGLDAHTIAKALQPFFTTKQDHGGLGLTQVAWTMDAAGGSLSIASTPGHGAKISLRLPAVDG